MIDSMGLKVFGEGEWKVRKHGKEKRRVWRKLHLAVDTDTHEIVSMVASLDSVHECEALPTQLNPLRRKIRKVSADGDYDTKRCYGVLERKRIAPVIPPRQNAAYWEEGHPRNQAVEALQNDQLEEWKTQSGYHECSLSETAMYRYKQLTSDKLSLRHYNAQAGEMMVSVSALNKMTRLGMPVCQVTG